MKGSLSLSGHASKARDESNVDGEDGNVETNDHVDTGINEKKGSFRERGFFDVLKDRSNKPHCIAFVSFENSQEVIESVELCNKSLKRGGNASTCELWVANSDGSCEKGTEKLDGWTFLSKFSIVLFVAKVSSARKVDFDEGEGRFSVFTPFLMKHVEMQHSSFEFGSIFVDGQGNFDLVSVEVRELQKVALYGRFTITCFSNLWLVLKYMLFQVVRPPLAASFRLLFYSESCGRLLAGKTSPDWRVWEKVTSRHQTLDCVARGGLVILVQRNGEDAFGPTWIDNHRILVILMEDSSSFAPPKIERFHVESRNDITTRFLVNLKGFEAVLKEYNFK